MSKRISKINEKKIEKKNLHVNDIEYNKRTKSSKMSKRVSKMNEKKSWKKNLHVNDIELFKYKKLNKFNYCFSLIICDHWTNTHEWNNF